MTTALAGRSSRPHGCQMTDRLLIEHAFDALVAREECFRFQEVATILARRRWPDLIASEPKKDRGADAQAIGSYAVGPKKVLACSTSPTIEKIKGDATKIRTNYPDTEQLIFATAGAVSNERIAKWSEAIKTAFGYELIVLPRRDLVLSLTEPENAWICRDLLHIDVAADPDDAELVHRFTRAAQEVTEQWQLQRRLQDEPLIDLGGVRVDQNGATGEAYDLSSMAAALSDRRRLFIEAPAGRGKTTTLIQLAKELAATNRLALLVDLPEWVTSGRTFLEHIGTAPMFRSAGLDLEKIARVLDIEPCVILLNGWNELSGNATEAAEYALRAVDRDYPMLGVAVATRPHAFRPPFADAVRIELLPLTRSQRAEYLRGAMGERGDELRVVIEQSAPIDALTRTPFILREVRRIFEVGQPLPSTKVGVLEAVLQLVEENPEHRSALQRPPLAGRAATYLKDIAVYMTAQGTVTIAEVTARAICRATSMRLVEEGQIGAPPEPADVLGALCDRHMLVRVEYPGVEFRFEHQQFQEFFASLVVLDRLHAVVNDGQAMALRFTEEFVNAPVWDEPLRMVAEAIASDTMKTSLGVALVRMALGIDPVFAADLARLARAEVWRKVGVEVGEHLRTWYSVDDPHHKRCALAGMLASGSPDFRDVIVPLLNAEDEHNRLQTYRSCDQFHLSTLGEDWQMVVREWSEKARRTFVRELTVYQRRSDVAEHLSLYDASLAVRKDAARNLAWIGAETMSTRAVEALPENVRNEVLLGLDPEDLAPTMIGSAVTAYDEQLRRVATSRERLRLLLRRSQIATPPAADVLKAELEQFSTDRLEFHDETLVRQAVEMIAGADRAWVSEWVAGRIEAGTLSLDRWKIHLTDLPRGRAAEWLARLQNERVDDRQRLLIGLVAAVADREIALIVFTRLCELRGQLDASHSRADDEQRAIVDQLETLFTSIHAPVALEIVEHLPSLDRDPAALREMTRLIGSGRADEVDLRAVLPELVRNSLKDYLAQGVPIACGVEEPRGELLAYLATAIARVGDEADVALVQALIDADLARVQRAQDARARGEHIDAMGWSQWHVRALLALGGQRAEDVLMQLLNEAEYEQHAASGLLQMATAQPAAAGAFGRDDRDVARIWQARNGSLPARFYEDRRARYADALKARVASLLEESQRREHPERYVRRLQSLAAVLAELDPTGSADLSMDIAALPARWAAWDRIAILEKLAFGGALLPAARTLPVLDMVVEHVRSAGVYDDQNRWLLNRSMTLMPFVEPPAVGIANLQQVINDMRFRSFELRDIFAALGYSRSLEAVTLLHDFATDDDANMKEIWGPWIEAVTAMENNEARALLLSFVEPDGEMRNHLRAMVKYEVGSLAAALATVARCHEPTHVRIFELARIAVDPSQELLLITVLALLGTPSAVVAGMELALGGAASPYEMREAFENIFLERRPDPRFPSAYTREPKRDDTVRRRLFEILVNDTQRSAGAFAYLGRVEEWRLEYGRPVDEPRHPAIDLGLPWPPLRLVVPQPQ
jgi:hypothetical protein